MRMFITALAAIAVSGAASVAYAQNPGADSAGQDQRPRSAIQDRPGGTPGSGTPSTVGSAPPTRSAPGAISPDPNGALGGRIPGQVNPDRAPPPVAPNR